MTLYHFGNCLALAYVPYYFAYKYAGLSEYGAFWKCIHAGGLYVFTQLAKMLILATFFPATDVAEGDTYDFIGEFFKSTVDLLDLVGIHLVLSGIPGKGHAKVMTAGIGWGGAELLLTRGLLLWIGARGQEFHWKYIQKCIESNIKMVQHVSTAALMWMWSRHDLKKSLLPFVTALLILTTYKPLLLEAAVLTLMCGPWSALLIRALVTFATAATTLHIYAGLAQSIGI